MNTSLNSLQKRDVNAFIKAIEHKFTVESNTWVNELDGVTVMRYSTPITHPWPREFQFSVDFLTSKSDAQEVVDIIHDHLEGAREEHVLTVFSLVPGRVIEAYESLGYQHAWTNILMARDLVTEDAALGNTAGVRSLGSDGDVDSINATAPDHRTTVEAVGDPYLHDYLIRDDGRVIAKAQIVTKPGEVAYVSDMFTAPTNRRRGYSRALMESLHRRARACGAERSILVPSLMAREIGLYQKYGYRETIPMVLLIPHRD